MKKYFVVSDVHSFYSIMMRELENSGFEIDNKEHIVILCGDAFDRGSEAEKMFQFLKDMKSQDRLIYIRGNHEDLLLKLLDSKYPSQHDYHNRTVETMMQIGHVSRDLISMGFDYCVERVKATGLYDFVKENTVDYFEGNHYIFVHGYVPTISNWRDAKAWMWDDARWSNGVDDFVYDTRDFGKNIVVGHWHCNWARDKFKPEEEKWKDFSPYKLKSVVGDNSIIAIDACVAYSGKINVLVLNENEI